MSWKSCLNVGSCTVCAQVILYRFLMTDSCAVLFECGVSDEVVQLSYNLVRVYALKSTLFHKTIVVCRYFLSSFGLFTFRQFASSDSQRRRALLCTESSTVK
jgi:hypothetical protein